MNLIAVVQLNSDDNIKRNLKRAENMIYRAADKGARLILLPENFAFMGENPKAMAAIAEKESNGPVQEFLAKQAQAHGVWLLGGSVPLLCSRPDRVRSASLLFNAQGEQVARYDKIHLFDATLTETGERYRESDIYESGQESCVVDTPVGRLGMTICYDLRFPELFRSMLDQDVELISIPSAFTATTGRVHWEPLLRARAIENQCYVLAPNQHGSSATGRRTWGHSSIVDPRGTIVNQVKSGTGIALAEISLEQVRSLRQSFPALSHRKFSCRFTAP
jgi:predicted amidohydrolase